METLKSLIQQVDDDYLIGLSNKGILKRAYKDLEAENPELVWQGGEAHVALKEESCVIRAPLGESSCSCPARSICRHIVTAILWLKDALSEDEGEATAGQEPFAEEPPKPLEEVLNFSAERLKRVCGNSRYRQFLTRIRNQEMPAVEESSIVAVTLPWENVTVKLLEPFAYSTCSCHSKELCVHKAQAVLIYQLSRKKITLKDLEALLEEKVSFDVEQMKQVCASVHESLCRQMCIGLSRQSQEISDELERLAVIAHRSGLPLMESRLRECASLYQQYFARSAAFRSEELMKRLLRIYMQAECLVHTEKQEEIRALAGTFRDTYDLVGQLHLMGIGICAFQSKNGYEGDIYYFLETHQRIWYTWTDARPVFYENTRRHPPVSMGNSMAPWNLGCSREQMLELEFELKNAKAAPGGRLSISQETKGEIVGNRNFRSEAFEHMISWDYENLVEQTLNPNDEKLALVGAVRWGETSFDKVSQRFSWSLFDVKGRTLFISLRYTKEEKAVIRLLERLEQRLKKDVKGAILFFGSLYLDEDGRMCLYPIEFFQKKELPVFEPAGDVTSAEKLPTSDVLQTMEQYHREAVSQLTDLFVSGLYSVQDAAAERITELGEEGERLGLHQVGKEFSALGRLLQEKRHRMNFTMEPVIIAMVHVYRYLSVGREKISRDRALLTMREERHHEPE